MDRILVSKTSDGGSNPPRLAIYAEDRNLNEPKAQMNKVIEEVGEMAHEIDEPIIKKVF